jgi:hypothetical protein
MSMSLIGVRVSNKSMGLIMRLLSKPEEPFGGYVELAGQQFLDEVDHDGRPTGSKDGVFDVFRDGLSDLVLVDKPGEARPVVGDSLVD